VALRIAAVATRPQRISVRRRLSPSHSTTPSGAMIVDREVVRPASSSTKIVLLPQIPDVNRAYSTLT
jgi:hypothetical protein